MIEVGLDLRGPGSPIWFWEEIEFLRENPLFVDGPKGDFKLFPDSPEIGGGIRSNPMAFGLYFSDREWWWWRGRFAFLEFFLLILLHRVLVD